MQRGAVAGAFRTILFKIFSFTELGLPTIVSDLSNKPRGLVLVTGPTGSGKTTTLYSLLRILNTDEVNIVTLEDPVEYFIEGVNQSQIKPDIHYTFNKGLRQIVRQDPDIIMVGEIRDEETAKLANHASLTGHLVLSTLHTNDAVGAIPRLIDMGLPAFLIGPSVRVVIAQRLVRKLCPLSRKKVRPNPAVKKLILAWGASTSFIDTVFQISPRRGTTPDCVRRCPNVRYH